MGRLDWLSTSSFKRHAHFRASLYSGEGTVPSGAKLKTTGMGILNLQQTGKSQMPEFQPQATEPMWFDFSSVAASRLPLLYLLWFLGVLEQCF